MPKPWVLVAFAAGLGGAAPTLIALAQGLTRQPADVPAWVYFIGVLIYFALGSAIAMIFAETDAKKAFFLGVSLPALIVTAQTQGGLSRSTQPQAPPKSEAVPAGKGSFHIVPRAFAQSRPGEVSGPGVPSSPPRGLRELIESNQGGGVGELGLPSSSQQSTGRELLFDPKSRCVSCDLWFFDKNGSILGKKPLPESDKGMAFPVPEGAESFGIWNETINPNRWSLPSQETGKYQYEFNYQRKIWNDFRRGLGNYSIKPYDLEIQKK